MIIIVLSKIKKFCESIHHEYEEYSSPINCFIKKPSLGKRRISIHTDYICLIEGIHVNKVQEKMEKYIHNIFFVPCCKSAGNFLHKFAYLLNLLSVTNSDMMNDVS